MYEGGEERRAGHAEDRARLSVYIKDRVLAMRAVDELLQLEGRFSLTGFLSVVKVCPRSILDQMGIAT
jgi:hypothetical protein